MKYDQIKYKCIAKCDTTWQTETDRHKLKPFHQGIGNAWSRQPRQIVMRSWKTLRRLTAVIRVLHKTNYSIWWQFKPILLPVVWSWGKSAPPDLCARRQYMSCKRPNNFLCLVLGMGNVPHTDHRRRVDGYCYYTIDFSLFGVIKSIDNYWIFTKQNVR